MFLPLVKFCLQYIKKYTRHKCNGSRRYVRLPQHSKQNCESSKETFRRQHWAKRFTLIIFSRATRHLHPSGRRDFSRFTPQRSRLVLRTHPVSSKALNHSPTDALHANPSPIHLLAPHASRIQFISEYAAYLTRHYSYVY